LPLDEETFWVEVAREVRRFGLEIRLRRIALGLRLIDLAPLAHLTPSYLGRIENGRRGTDPSLGVAIAVARGLGTSIQDLLGGFKGLTPLGIEAGRICDALPARMQSGAIDLLRAMDPRRHGEPHDER